MSSRSGSITAVVSLATAIGAVVLSFPAFAQVQNNSGQNNSDAGTVPLGSVITVTPDGKRIVTPPTGNSGQGTGGGNNTGNSSTGTTSTGTSGATTGTPTTGATDRTPTTGVSNGTPTTGVTDGTPTTGVTIPSTGTAPASTTPVGGSNSQ